MILVPKPSSSRSIVTFPHDKGKHQHSTQRRVRVIIFCVSSRLRSVTRVCASVRVTHVQRGIPSRVKSFANGEHQHLSRAHFSPRPSFRKRCKSAGAPLAARPRLPAKFTDLHLRGVGDCRSRDEGRRPDGLLCRLEERLVTRHANRVRLLSSGLCVWLPVLSTTRALSSAGISAKSSASEHARRAPLPEEAGGRPSAT